MAHPIIRTLLVGALGIVGALVLWFAMPTPIAQQFQTSGNKIAFPERYAEGVMYTTVDHSASSRRSATGLEDAAQYRKFYAPVGTIKALRNGEQIPSGSVLVMVKYRAKLDSRGNPIKHENNRFIKGDLMGFSVMEKRTGWGAEYPPEIRTGEWEFREFTADQKPNDNVDLVVCFHCHRSQAKTDYVFTFNSIKAVFAK